MRETTVRIGDVLERIDAGWSPLCSEETPRSGEWGVLKVSAVTSGNYRPEESKTLLPGLKPRPEIEVRPGDVIMCRANGVKELVGATAIVADTPAGLMLSDKTLRLVPDPAQLHPKYLYYFLSSHQAKNQIARMASGSSGQNNISQRFIRSLTMNLPSLAEQHRIVEILDSAEDQIRRTEQIVVKLRVQKSGLLQQLIGEESAKNSPFHVGGALLRIDAGWSPLCDEEPPSGDRWGVLKVSAVTSGRYIPRESKTLLAGLAPRPEIEVKNGDVIMCRANGAKELVGTVAMIRDTPPKLMLSDKTLRLIANTAVLSPAYLCHFMKSWPARKQIGELLSGSSGQNNISQKFIRSMRIPIPDLPRQQQIVEVLSVAENRIEAESSSLGGLQRLKQGLMDDLFMGRLRVSTLYLGMEFAIG